MRYFESDSDFSSSNINSPLDLVRFIITCVFLSPLRLVLEVSKKIMFTGEYFKKFIMNCIYINVGLIVLSLLSSLFITKRFYLYGNLLPISSLVVSLLVILGFYYFEKSKSLEVNFQSEDSVEDSLKNISDVYDVDLGEVDSEPSHNESPSKVADDYLHHSTFDDEEEIEINSEDDFDKVYDQVVESVTPTIDPSKRAEIAARLEAQKALIRESTQLHEPSTNVKQEFLDVMDQEKSKLDIIKDNSVNSDTDVIDSKIENLTSLIRGSKVSPASIDVIDSDDSIVNDSMNTLMEYTKNINSRVAKKNASLDDLVSNQNSSVMMEVDDDSEDFKVTGNSNVDRFSGYLGSDVSDSDVSDNDEVDGYSAGIEDGYDVYYGGGLNEDVLGIDPSFSNDFY